MDFRRHEAVRVRAVLHGAGQGADFRGGRRNGELLAFTRRAEKSDFAMRRVFARSERGTHGE